jgi:hypothetical protein
MTTPNDTPEPSPASAGSQPVAWAIQWNGSGAPDLEWVFPERRDVDLELLETPSKGVAVPLYCQPQPALTDEEREALESLVFAARLYAPERTAGVIQRLLERLGKANE